MSEDSCPCPHPIPNRYHCQATEGRRKGIVGLRTRCGLPALVKPLKVTSPHLGDTHLFPPTQRRGKKEFLGTQQAQVLLNLHITFLVVVMVSIIELIGCLWPTKQGERGEHPILQVPIFFHIGTSLERLLRPPFSATHLLLLVETDH